MPFNLTALFDGLAGCPGVAIAVSGGSDSMALVRLARAWNGAPLMALTVDHGLRAGSADEARQVKAWCDAIGVAHKVLTWRGPKPASGLQAAARQARYSLMAEDCRAHGLPVLLTGHTLEDQAETVAMRARRTQSVVSLAGIWPETQWNGVTVRRPLLALRRAALRGWLQDLGQGWIDDPSNNDQRFERVRVRKAMAEGDVAALASRADAARRDAASLSVAVDAWITQHVTRHPEGHLTFAREDAVAAAVPLRRVVLARLVRQVGGSAGLEMAELDRLSAAIAEGRKVTLGGAVMAPRGGAVWLAREAKTSSLHYTMQCSWSQHLQK